MSHPLTPRPTASTPAAPAAGGRPTTTSNGVLHPAPGSNSAPGITPELLTTADAAKLLSIGERTLWRWSRCGIAPAPVKIGQGPRAAVRFRRQELVEWAMAGCPRTDGRNNQR